MSPEPTFRKVIDRTGRLIDTINTLGSIPSTYLPQLNDRLPILCLDFPRQRRTRKSTPRPPKENKALCFTRKQQQAYLETLSQKPTILLGFILAAAPTFCRTVNIYQFLQEYDHESECFLNEAIQSQLDKIAHTNQLSLLSRYQTLINALRAKPKTVAENGGFGNRKYESANWEGSYNAFGDKLCEEMFKGNKKPPHAPVTTWAPCNGDGDLIVELDIVEGKTLGRALFPAFDATLAQEPGSLLDSEAETNIDIRKAPISSLSIFTSSIQDVLDASELRGWEKDHHLTETDCVSMRWNRQLGWKLRLRVGLFAFSLILNELYGDES